MGSFCFEFSQLEFVNFRWASIFSPAFLLLFYFLSILNGFLRRALIGLVQPVELFAL